MSWFSRKDEKPQEIKLEDQIFNPFKAHLGDFIEIKGIEDQTTSIIIEIKEYARKLSGEIFKFAQYHLEDGTVLRVVPKSKDVYDIVEMKILWSGEFEEDIQEAVKCKEFYQNLDDGTKITFYALNAGESGFHCDIKSIDSLNYLKYEEIKYWDFFRKPDFMKGETTIEDILLFVEIDQTDGYISIWEGSLIPYNDVKVYLKTQEGK